MYYSVPLRFVVWPFFGQFYTPFAEFSKVHSAFSKLCSSMENTHVSKYNSTSRCVLSRHVEWYMSCLYKFLCHVVATTGLNKMKLKLLKILKTKKTDKAIIIQASDWAQNTHWSWGGCEAPISPPNHLHLDPYLLSDPPKFPPSLLSSSPNCHN